VEGNLLYRQGVRLALRQAGCEVVGEASTGASALELAARLKPDVVVMDSELSGVSTLSTIRRLSTLVPNSRVIVLAGQPDEDGVVAMLAAGASGYLSKRTSKEQLAHAICATPVGEVPISPEIAAKLARRLRRDLRERLDAETLDAVLTEREIEVIRLVSQGLENAAIARALSLSPATVRKHVSNILAKLGLRNRVEAAVYAVLTGIGSVMTVS
jgi:DNA-binding NarL/FixJ family response regulator